MYDFYGIWTVYKVQRGTNLEKVMNLVTFKLNHAGLHNKAWTLKNSILETKMSWPKNKI